MRFFCYTLGAETATPPEPNPDLAVEIDKFVAEAMGAGALLATGGLAPTSEGTLVAYADGEYTVTDGPFAEAKELIGGWALMEVRDKDEAIEWTKRFLTIVGGGETRIRQVFGPE